MAYNRTTLQTYTNDASTGLYRDGQSAGAITEADHRAMVTAIAEAAVVHDDFTPVVVSGTDTYTATITYFGDNVRYRLLFFKFTNANTGAATLNVNAGGAVAIKKNVSVALAAGDIAAGGIYLLGYDGTNYQLISSVSPATSVNTDTAFFEAEEFILGSIGRSSWAASGSGAGATFDLLAPGYGHDTTENAIGVASLSSGTTTTGREHIFRYGLVLGTHTIRFRFRAAVSNLSDGTETYSIRMGLSDLTNITTGNPDNGVFFRYTHSVNSGEYEAVSFAATSSTTTDTNVATATTYKVFEIAINQARTSITFYIDGTLVATHTTNIPASTVELYFYAQILKSAGTTNRNLHFDWTEITLTRSSAR